jgi:hypothetical protein
VTLPYAVMVTNSFNRYIVTVTITLLVTIVTKETFSNLLVTKTRKRPNFSKIRNDLTVNNFLGGEETRAM